MGIRRRRKFNGISDDAEVAMSPLIDCVFLLLIFFLVTTILKRKEKLIRVEMPDNTASVARDTMDEEFIIGMDSKGHYLCVTGKENDGRLRWGIIPDLPVFLEKKIKEKGASFFHKPIRIDADGEIEFQKAINALDICKLLGFTSVSLKLKQGANDGNSNRRRR